MIANFGTLEDIFKDEDFSELIANLKPSKEKILDPEVQKFEDILRFIEENNREPKLSNLKERGLYSRLKGIRENQDKLVKLKPYDSLNILGD